jgi:hypothetical protein
MSLRGAVICGPCAIMRTREVASGAIVHNGDTKVKVMFLTSANISLHFSTSQRVKN